GFMVKRHHGSFRFIHSSGSNPARVVEQDRENAWVLRQSHWRMLGNLTADRSVIRRWLKGEQIHIHGSHVE
ncbi:MAG: hypothetical protein ACO3RV_09410, partial [Luteolibacter sp.]